MRACDSKKILKGFLFTLVLLLTQVWSYPFEKKDTAKDSNVFEINVGEELVYNVSFSFINLGKISLKVVEKNTDEDSITYKTIAIIESYKGIPFVDLYEVYESVFNQLIFSYRFRGDSRTKKGNKYVTYNFDYNNHRVYLENGRYDSIRTIASIDTLDVNSYCQDGLSLFYFARQNLFKNESITIPTIINEELRSTTINFFNKRTSAKIRAIDYPVDVIEFNGQANFEGVYGFSGEFEGWFSNDEARIPILAKLKVFIGKVRIELMQWKRKNWIPPKSMRELKTHDIRN